jgi:hypothetical protein
MRKIVINDCFGGFGLSEAAYEKLIEWGVPVKKYVEQERDPVTGLYKDQPLNDGEAIFDRDLDNHSSELARSTRRLCGRYWDTWIDSSRDHPLVVRVVEELGSEAASGRFAKLKIVEIPDDVEWGIAEYDGTEHVEEAHRTWG